MSVNQEAQRFRGRYVTITLRSGDQIKGQITDTVDDVVHLESGARVAVTEIAVMVPLPKQDETEALIAAWRDSAQPKGAA